jgi:hypothetical protein
LVATGGQRLISSRKVPSGSPLASSCQRRTSITAPTLMVSSWSGMYQNQPSAKAAPKRLLASSPGSRSASRK